MSPASEPHLEDLQQRYAAIEQVYAEQNWPEVEAQCDSLLAELPDEPGHPLRQRLLLLLAHTQLYGMGDPATAASLYSAVLRSRPEAVLAEIAEQGLAQCNQLEPGAGASAEPEQPAPEQAAAESTSPSSAAAAAMPWMQELGMDPQPQPQPVDPTLALAPFQRPSPEPSEPDPQDAAPVSASNAGEDSPQPLRWPFMAGYVERRLPGQLPEGPEPAGSNPEATSQTFERQPEPQSQPAVALEPSPALAIEPTSAEAENDAPNPAGSEAETTIAAPLIAAAVEEAAALEEAASLVEETTAVVVEAADEILLVEETLLEAPPAVMAADQGWLDEPDSDLLPSPLSEEERAELAKGLLRIEINVALA